MNHVGEWDTPTLVIHSGKDFRLVDGEGIGESSCFFLFVSFRNGGREFRADPVLAAFTALQV